MGSISNRLKRSVWGFAVILLVAFVGSAHAEPGVTPGSKAEGMQSCVAPTADIRRYHMDYLKHDRDETVRKGIRAVKHSLAECLDCHAGKDDQGNYLPVDAEGQFCAGCHRYTAVSPNCFQCHRTTPAGAVGTATTGAGHE